MRLALLSLFLLGACSTTPVMLQRPPQADAPFVFNGRVAMRQEARRENANLRWTHRGNGDEILLLAPLGRTVARITVDTARATLETDDKLYAATDAEALMQQVLGWRLPLSGLRYWVTGLPAPEARYEKTPGENGQIGELRQQGWTIRYSRHTSAASDALPLRLNLQREGLEVRLVIDEWEAQ